MEGIPQPKTVKVFQLIKMAGMSFSLINSSSSNSIGVGFYHTLQEAEHNRSMEILKDTTSSGAKPTWHIFELEFPNAAYKDDRS